MYNKMMNFTGNAVCGLTKTGWDQRTPEELWTQITRKNFTLPFSRERQGESQMTRIPQTSRTMFKGSNRGFQTPCLGHRHNEDVITECQSEPSHFVKRDFKLLSQVTDTILKYSGGCKDFRMSMQNSRNTSSPLQRPHRQTTQMQLTAGLSSMFVFLIPSSEGWKKGRYELKL